MRLELLSKCKRTVFPDIHHQQMQFYDKEARQSTAEPRILSFPFHIAKQAFLSARDREITFV